MTKEEGLSLGETAHPLKPHKMGPSGALMEGNRANHTFDRLSRDGIPLSSRKH